jgi:hypothetical protein
MAGKPLYSFLLSPGEERIGLRGEYMGVVRMRNIKRGEGGRRKGNFWCIYSGLEGDGEAGIPILRANHKV